MGIVAGMFWLFFAGIGVLIAGVIGLVIFVATWANQEPAFSAPIEWRSNAQSDDWRGEETPVVIRLESDGSAWVEAFPITQSSALPWPEWASNCYDNRDGETYTGPAMWNSDSGGGIELEVLGSGTGMLAGTFLLRQDWTAPQIYSCTDGSADIDLEIVCGDPGYARPEGWTPCEPQSG